jgi:hypothetical protein
LNILTDKELPEIPSHFISSGKLVVTNLALSLNSLIEGLRVMAHDLGTEGFQEYTDEDLIKNLKIGIALVNAEWEQGYSVALNGTSGEYEISPDPPEWLCMLYLLRTACGMRIFQLLYSVDNKVVKVTNNTKKDDVKDLKELYQRILDERRYGDVIGYVSTVFDDYFTRPNLIFDAISQGYR